MSPEQVSGNVRLDGRSDIYSLGCVLYEMLAGEPPFIGPSAGVTAGHLVDPPPRLSAKRPSLPRELDTIVATALAKLPADRFRPRAISRKHSRPWSWVARGAGPWCGAPWPPPWWPLRWRSLAVLFVAPGRRGAGAG